jgi:hypothetical protein
VKSIEPEALVITDKDGNYYVLPRELVEVSRIEPEAKPRVDEYLREAEGLDSAADGIRYLGAIKLPAESKWTHFSPSVAWPNGGAPGRQHPGHIVMLDKPVVSPAAE